MSYVLPEDQLESESIDAHYWHRYANGDESNEVLGFLTSEHFRSKFGSRLFARMQKSLYTVTPYITIGRISFLDPVKSVKILGEIDNLLDGRNVLSIAIRKMLRGQEGAYFLSSALAAAAAFDSSVVSSDGWDKAFTSCITLDPLVFSDMNSNRVHWFKNTWLEQIENDLGEGMADMAYRLRRALGTPNLVMPAYSELVCIKDNNVYYVDPWGEKVPAIEGIHYLLMKSTNEPKNWGKFAFDIMIDGLIRCEHSIMQAFLLIISKLYVDFRLMSINPDKPEFVFRAICYFKGKRGSIGSTAQKIKKACTELKSFSWMTMFASGSINLEKDVDSGQYTIKGETKDIWFVEIAGALLKYLSEDKPEVCLCNTQNIIDTCLRVTRDSFIEDFEKIDTIVNAMILTKNAEPKKYCEYIKNRHNSFKDDISNLTVCKDIQHIINIADKMIETAELTTNITTDYDHLEGPARDIAIVKSLIDINGIGIKPGSGWMADFIPVSNVPVNIENSKYTIRLINGEFSITGNNKVKKILVAMFTSFK
jgi:hypothetical protein